jgi:hypothetical protein
MKVEINLITGFVCVDFLFFFFSKDYYSIKYLFYYELLLAFTLGRSCACVRPKANI